MEVHAHSHTPRKKWTHYFWEFLMLFLAVFCGFLAENQREHIIENHREKQFMQTYLDDIKTDTAEINEDIETWMGIISHIDSLRIELEKPGVGQDLVLMYRANTSILFNYTTFRYNDRTIQQLRNSGNFRLINRVVADSMMHYDGTARTSIKDRELIIREIYLELVHLHNSLFDSGITERVRKKKSIDTLIYTGPIQNKNNLYQYYNDLFFYKIKVENLISRLLELHDNAINLMKLIKQKYRLR